MTAALALMLFVLAAWQVRVRGPLLSPDERLSRALVRTVPDGVTERLADLGNIPVAVPVLALAMVWTARRTRRLREPLVAGLAMALVPAVIVPLKAWTARNGPLEPWAAGYFPSGHTATATVAYGAAALLLAPLFGAGRRWWSTAAAGVLSLATAVGLVLRGFHWPLDVLASWLLCVVLLSPSWLLCRERLRGTGSVTDSATATAQPK
ncbi:phosphatase PAP2 family protein [Streptomyces sp. NPDC097619]|uniref:phosphatase PAP2 family protein n=1 Tax=Streptomyces sp. NPDC097619 TaxID=3157228 RepID=UPI0033335C4C